MLGVLLLAFVEHLLIVEYFFGDEGQLIHVFFHFVFIQLFHLPEVDIRMINMLYFNRANPFIHEVLHLCRYFFITQFDS